MTISIIVATTQNWVIGRDKQMPWHLSDDLKHFRRITLNHSIIMGRRTFDSIGKPLPKRRNILISRRAKSSDYPEGVEVTSSLDEALKLTNKESEIFIIGGGQIYEQSLHLAHQIYLTQIQTKLEGDTYFPALDWKDWELEHLDNIQKDEKNDYNCKLLLLKRLPSE